MAKRATATTRAKAAVEVREEGGAQGLGDRGEARQEGGDEDGCAEARGADGGAEGRAQATARRCPAGEPNIISVRGAREHNLRDVDIDLPRDQLVVFTGLSGSGKSSLAFDTIYAEGQRRYVESLSAYARQFLGQMDKPDVDFIEGLSPAISIDQKSASRNPRSTVGTITEIYDYLRLLYARIGIPHCPNCGRVITRQTPQQIVDRVLQLPEGTRFQVLAPVVRGRKGEYEGLLDELAEQGFTRARIDGEVVELADRTQERARPLREPHDRGRRRPAGAPGRASSAGSPTRSRPRCGSPRASPRSRSSRRTARTGAEPEILTFSEHLACTHAACRSTSSRRATSRSTRRTARASAATASARASRSTPSSIVADDDLSIDEGAIAPWSGLPRRVLQPGARRGRRRVRLLDRRRRGRS